MSLNKIKIINSKIIKNVKGNVIKIIDKRNKKFKKFGEIYFSEIKKNHNKGWNLHKKFYCQIFLCSGSVEIKLKDKLNKKKKIKLSNKNPKMVIIPPNTWFSFVSREKKSIIFNILSNIYDPKETLKKF